ncbi:MAG: hypothetical protein NC911_08780 [Candidatus Omnitrophica bacterium]|nr:hypothetical protein [Candidatus Omnitrophota bacterium]
MRKNFPCLLFSFSVVFGSLPITGQATDVAFWKPYQTDNFTYLLVNFDTPDLTQAEGKITAPARLKGQVNFSSAGKFAGCADFSG